MSIPWRWGCPEGPSQSLAKPQGPAAPRGPQAKQAETPLSSGHLRAPSCHPALVTPSRVNVPSACALPLHGGASSVPERRGGGRGDLEEGPSLAPRPAAAEDFALAASESGGALAQGQCALLRGGSVGVPRGACCTRAGTHIHDAAATPPKGVHWEPPCSPPALPRCQVQ